MNILFKVLAASSSLFASFPSFLSSSSANIAKARSCRPAVYNTGNNQFGHPLFVNPRDTVLVDTISSNDALLRDDPHARSIVALLLVRPPPIPQIPVLAQLAASLAPLELVHNLPVGHYCVHPGLLSFVRNADSEGCDAVQLILDDGADLRVVRRVGKGVGLGAGRVKDNAETAAVLCSKAVAKGSAGGDCKLGVGRNQVRMYISILTRTATCGGRLGVWKGASYIYLMVRLAWRTWFRVDKTTTKKKSVGASSYLRCDMAEEDTCIYVVVMYD